MMTKESPGIIGFVGCPNSPQNTLCSLQFHSALHAIVSTFYRHVGKGLLCIYVKVMPKLSFRPLLAHFWIYYPLIGFSGDNLTLAIAFKCATVRKFLFACAYNLKGCFRWHCCEGLDGIHFSTNNR